MEVTDSTVRTQCLEETDDALDLVVQTLDAIDRFNRAIASSRSTAASDVYSDVEDCLKALDELFSDADEERRSRIISAVLSGRPHSLRNFYMFAEKAYDDWDGSGSSCYSLVLSNLVSWTDQGKLLVHEINAQGLLVIHFNHLLELHQKEDDLDLAVFEKLAMEMLTIIHNCVKDPNLQRFYFGNNIDWIQVLLPWIQCSHSTLRMLVRFVLSYLRFRLSDESSKLLNMDDNDWRMFMTMFTDCCQPPNFVATMVGTMAPIMQQFTQLVARAPAMQGASSSPPCEDDVKSHLLQALNYPFHDISVTKDGITASIDATEGSYLFSASEILKALENLLTTEPNINAFKAFDYLPHVKNLLRHGKNEEKISACSLLWCLARHYPAVQTELRQEDSMLCTALKQLHNNEDSTLQLLSICVGICVGRDCDEESQMVYIRCCYQYKKYHDCIEYSNKIDYLTEAQVYKAKALYQVYTQEHVLLTAEQDSLAPRVLHQRRNACFSKTKSVINILGRLLDGNEEAFDCECSQILDLAMMDYIFQTNCLRDCQRCFLCRNITVSHQCPTDPKEKKGDTALSLQTKELSVLTQRMNLSSEDGSKHSENVEINVIEHFNSGVTGKLDISDTLHKSQSTVKSDKNKHQRGLQASHLFPEAIIKRFVGAVPLTKGKKVCLLSGLRPSFDPLREHLHSSGKATLYMLCHDCEQLLGTSESWFMQNVFSKVYDPCEPSKPMERQDIPYNDHLYRFCIGLLFRLLNYDDTAILNPNEIYSLLLQCRAVLRPESVAQSVEKPDVYFFMTPIVEEGDEYGFINKFLTGTLSRMYGMHHLNTDLQSFSAITPPSRTFVHFVVVHMGVMNILVKFKPSADYEINSHFLIHPEGGVYIAPPNSDRKRDIPPGVYTLFQVHAMEMERKWLEGPSLSYEPLQCPDERVSEMFGILKAEAKDESRLISEKQLTHVSADHPRTLCFLPPGFDVTPPISVPSDHSILLHHTHGDTEKGLILFLGVGLNKSDGYGLDKPYVIMYNYLPGNIFASCCFISLEEMQPIGFLPRTKGISTVSNQDEILRDIQQKDIASVVHCMLKEKGFHSLRSLIYRLVAARDLPLVDAQCTPCSQEEVKRCAYCANKCDCCFKPVPKMAISLEGPDDSDLDFKFCSSQCYQISVQPPQSCCYYLIDNKGNLQDIDNKCNYVRSEGFTPFCGPVASSHIKLFHILCIGTNWAGYLREDEIALCMGSFEHPHEQLYVVYRGRSLTGQLCLEFFVSDDLSPNYPLPYLMTEDTIEEVTGLKDDEIIQPHLIHAVKVVSGIVGYDISLSFPKFTSDLLHALSLIFPYHESEQNDDIAAESVTEAN